MSGIVDKGHIEPFDIGVFDVGDILLAEVGAYIAVIHIDVIGSRRVLQLVL